LNIVSCSSYDKYAETKQEFARTESVRMQTQGEVILKAFGLIMAQLGGNKDGDNYLINHTYYDSEGRKHELKVKDAAVSSNAVLMSMQFMPVLERIYKQQQLEMSTPTTSEDIAMSFIKQLPILGAIWGFTSLGNSAGSSYENVNNPSTSTTVIENNPVTNTSSVGDTLTSP